MAPTFVETMAFQAGNFPLLAYHEARLQRTQQAHFPRAAPIALREALTAQVAQWRIQAAFAERQYYKCRVVYGARGIETIALTPYAPHPIESLRLVDAPSGLDYTHKSTDRTALEALYAQRGACDDVLMVRDGWLTDSFYCNVALEQGGKWYTPMRPLLAGVRRASLLEGGVIMPREIHVTDCADFSAIRLFNALLPWEVAPTLPIGHVYGDY